MRSSWFLWAVFFISLAFNAVVSLWMVQKAAPNCLKEQISPRAPLSNETSINEHLSTNDTTIDQDEIFVKWNPPEIENRPDPLNIAIVTMFNSESNSTASTFVAQISLRNKIEYAHRFGYPFFFYHASIPVKEVKFGWSKLLIVKKYLQSYDWIFWMDLDSIITNFDTSIESVIQSAAELKKANQELDFIIGRDWNNINTGEYLIRNCEWSWNFLSIAFSYSSENTTGPWTDQQGMINYSKKYPDYYQHQVEVPLRMINSYDNVVWPSVMQRHQDLHHRPGDFILHLPGITDERRLPVFLQYTKDYPLPGFNQNNNGSWALKVRKFY